MYNIRYFEVAKAVAKTSEYPRIKIGCCIVKKNKILAVGTNMVKSHPMQKRYNRFRSIASNCLHHNIHAELDAILKVTNKESLVGASIYLYRENRFGNLRICRPCAACMELIRDRGIKHIYFTDIDGYHREELI